MKSKNESNRSAGFRPFSGPGKMSDGEKVEIDIGVSQFGMEKHSVFRLNGYERKRDSEQEEREKRQGRAIVGPNKPLQQTGAALRLFSVYCPASGPGS